jgi:Trk K+ transport system NAD-binding subunit
MEGDGCDPDIYKQLKLHEPDYVVVETGSPERNHDVCKLLRNVLQHENIMTRSGKSDYALRLKNLGVDAIDIIGIQATTYENLILRPTTYHALIESFENFSVEEILITNKAIDGAQLREVPFHKNAILIMVKRGNAYFIPHGETHFRTGDILHVFGTDTALQETREKMK